MEDYEALLRARGDVPIGYLRNLHAALTQLLNAIDEIDKVLDIEPNSYTASSSIVDTLRKRRPDIAHLTDEQILAVFNVENKT